MGQKWAAIDLTGQKFGLLTVVKRAKDFVSFSGTKRVMWYCRCDCGNEVIVRSTHLRDGTTKSCGCYKGYKLEQYRQANRKYNKYDLDSKDFGVGYTLKNQKFYFDKEDFDKIKEYLWSYNKYDALQASRGKPKATIFMHRLVLGLKRGEGFVHHINGNKWDNRKKNLLVSRSNAKKPRERIIWDGDLGRWIISDREEILYKGGDG